MNLRAALCAIPNSFRKIHSPQGGRINRFSHDIKRQLGGKIYAKLVNKVLSSKIYE